MKKITLRLKNKKIPIKISKNIIFSKIFIKFLKTLKTNNFVIITDIKIENFFAKKLQNFLKSFNISSFIISVPEGEEHKTRKTKENIEDILFQKKVSKDFCIIAMGGGVICDIASFTASTYMRGLSLILIPTTLLAMVDACIGGKTAINTPFSKNSIGTFYNPKAVFIDTFFLSTLDEKEYKNGFAEILKYGLILDKKLFFKIPKTFKNFKNLNNNEIENLIHKCVLLKKKIVEKDFYEKNKRKILNFGHTIGHVIESENFSDEKFSHGEAIVFGMIFASYLSFRLKFLKEKDFLKIFKIFKNFNFNLKFSKKLNIKNFKERLLLDKKVRNRKIEFVLLKKIGKIKTFKKNKKPFKKSFSKEIDENLLQKALIWMDKTFF